jgi:hypothetical protein
MSDIIDKEIAALTRRIRTAENDFAHARLHDFGHPDTEKLRRAIVADKRRLVDLAEQRARTRSADELHARNNAVFFGSSN